MGWKQVNLSEVQLNGISRADFDAVWGKHMQLWRPDSVPAGETYFKLTALTFDTSGNMGCYPAAAVGCAIAEGWNNPDKPLPPDNPPKGGDPRGYPNLGLVDFCGGDGMAEFIWGSGEGYAPEDVEGPHWFYVPEGPSGTWTDVIYGFGWRKGTNHYKLWPVFEKATGTIDPPVDPPSDGTVAAELKAIAAHVNNLAALFGG
jgi:hypothetical protein